MHAIITIIFTGGAATSPAGEHPANKVPMVKDAAVERDGRLVLVSPCSDPGRTVTNGTS